MSKTRSHCSGNTRSSNNSSRNSVRTNLPKITNEGIGNWSQIHQTHQAADNLTNQSQTDTANLAMVEVRQAYYQHHGSQSKSWEAKVLPANGYDADRCITKRTSALNTHEEVTLHDSWTRLLPQTGPEGTKSNARSPSTINNQKLIVLSRHLARWQMFIKGELGLQRLAMQTWMAKSNSIQPHRITLKSRVALESPQAHMSCKYLCGTSRLDMSHIIHVVFIRDGSEDMQRGWALIDCGATIIFISPRVGLRLGVAAKPAYVTSLGLNSLILAHSSYSQKTASQISLSSTDHQFKNRWCSLYPCRHAT